MTSIAPVAARPAVAPKAPVHALDEPNPGLLPGVIAERSQRGRIAENTADTLPPDVAKNGAPKYFRTYEQVKAALNDIATKYPQLATVTDIGDSWEKTQHKADRDVLMLTLTNKNIAGKKPVVEHIGGVHAREIANPELLMEWAKQLVEGYGRDPQATAMLDTREIEIIPIVNPDGHAKIERAYAGQPAGDLMQRKNTDGRDGTDLNRNYDFHWGGPGASNDPYDQTYRGARAASEPETQALQHQSDVKPPSIFVDWHSYSRLNLYPWGDTSKHAPDYAGLKAIAEKFSTFNHYSPIQSIDLYPTTGTSDDWNYAKHQVAALSVETGDNFHQTDQEFAATLQENLPALWYTAKIADHPYTEVLGPDALNVLIDPTTKAVSAKVSDVDNGKQAIKGAELVLDPNQAAGTGVPLTAADGKFDSPAETVKGSLQGVPGAGDAATAGKLVYVRAQDTAGNWGPLTAQWLSGPATEASTQSVAANDAAAKDKRVRDYVNFIRNYKPDPRAYDGS